MQQRRQRQSSFTSLQFLMSTEQEFDVWVKSRLPGFHHMWRARVGTLAPGDWALPITDVTE
jgi:hypothetical protein